LEETKVKVREEEKQKADGDDFDEEKPIEDAVV